MWDRLILIPGLGFWLGDKASRAEIAEVEEALGVTLPRSLRGFLSEMNGCAINLAGLELPDGDSQMIKLIWSCDEIIRENRALRAGDAAPDRHMAYGDLLWFARRPGGDLAGFQVIGGKVTDPTVFVFSPNQFSEPRPQAVSLRQYLVDFLADYQREHPESPLDFL